MSAAPEPLPHDVPPLERITHDLPLDEKKESTDDAVDRVQRKEEEFVNRHLPLCEIGRVSSHHPWASRQQPIEFVIRMVDAMYRQVIHQPRQEPNERANLKSLDIISPTNRALLTAFCNPCDLSSLPASSPLFQDSVRIMELKRELVYEPPPFVNRMAKTEMKREEFVAERETKREEDIRLKIETAPTTAPEPEVGLPTPSSSHVPGEMAQEYGDMVIHNHRPTIHHIVNRFNTELHELENQLKNKDDRLTRYFELPLVTPKDVIVPSEDWEELQRTYNKDLLEDIKNTRALLKNVLRPPNVEALTKGFRTIKI